jgi:hypothetical protein
MKVAQKITRILYQILVRGVDYDANYERKMRKQQEQTRILKRQTSLLSSRRLRPLKRDIQSFFVDNHQYSNSYSRYHLIKGFNSIIDKASKLNPQKKQIKKKRAENL